MNDVKIVLLTHERELDRPTSTSRVVKDVLQDTCEVIPWKRTEPASQFQSVLSPGDTALVYKTEQGSPIESLDAIKHFIVLEGTWQEARKIYNRSPYLKQYKIMQIEPTVKSRYTMRRNQVSSGLCTAETVIEILRLKEQYKLADKLLERFTEFQQISR